ncbi:RING/U-box superfamily protein [Striga hermonthica]|uniref:RING/U-box superfamily protein n=1 Tax=Striga hermonthica TaxID=68872 RepID=A0A9N7RHE6_STRHE|nr:RING/U-box superfamily protein [Striga hermonthica]
MSSLNPSSSLPSSLDELSYHGASALYLPLVTVANPPHEVAVQVHPTNISMTLVESVDDLEALHWFWVKLGPSPVTRALIDALPVVSTPETGLECSICVVEYEINAAVKEMSCSNRFHRSCIYMSGDPNV